jgi:hypothetical protein
MALANAPAPVMSFTPAVHTASPMPVHHTSFAHANPAALHLPVLSGGTGGNLNLASTQMTFLANNLANFTSLSIDVGGKQEQVNLSTKLTAAEVVAVEQVITGGAGGQTIKIGANGAATGGTVNLNNNLLTALDKSMGGSIASMTVAKHVDIVDSVGQLSLSGRLANYGEIQTASGSSGNSDLISANSVLNAGGASISSYSGGGGLYAANPVINAATSVTNNGTISSSGNLSISATTVTNAPSHGSTASITAANDVNISTQSLSNSGAIAALTGNVNVASAGGINLSGAGGTIQANNGNINLSSTDADINVSGGNYLSQQVNFNAGTGDVNGQMGNVTGVVNASGYCVHLGADAATLNLGAINASGDPTITNTGNLSIDNTISATGGGNLTLIAGGNIVSAAGNVGLNTSAATGNGGQLNLIAGAVFTPATSGMQAGSTTVTKGSATGGFIDLTGGGTAPITSITSASGGGNGNGGNITMVAFAGTAANSGTVNVPSGVAINAAGNGTGTGGNVTIVAGAKSGAAITAGAITTGGIVTVDTSAPTIVPAKGTTGVVFDSTGLMSTGAFGASATANAASAALGNVTGTLNTLSGGAVTVANTSPLTLGTINGGKTGTFSATDTGNSINVTGVVTGASSTLTTTGTGTTTTSGSGSINTAALSLNAGTGVDIVATNVSSLTVNTGANLTDNQGTATMGVSGAVTGASTLTINSNGQVNLNGPLSFAGAGTLAVTASATDKGGIAVSAPIFLPTSTVTLTSLGKGLITETAGTVLTANSANLVSNTNIGGKAAPFQTNAVNLDVEDTGAKNISYVNDQNINTLNFTGNKTAAAGGSLFLTSTAANLNVTNANYANVSITDNLTSAAANGVNFNNAAGVYGTGAGTFTVVSFGGMADSGAAFLNGTTVTLTATGPGSNVGKNAGNPMFLDSANLVLNSAQGSVFASDKIAAVVNGAASLTGVFSVTDTGAPMGKETASLTVGKSVGGGTIDLTTSGAGTNIALTGTTGTATTGTVNINSASGLTTKGAINGSVINFTTDGIVTFGGAVGNASSSLGFNNTGTAPITLSGTLSGNNISFTSAGPITVTKAISGSGPDSKVSIVGTATSSTANAVTIDAAITGSQITIGSGALGSVAINDPIGNAATLQTTISAGDGGVGHTGPGGVITGIGLVSGTVVTLNALGTTGSIGSSAKPIQTAAGTLSPNASGTGSTDGAFVTQKGNMTLGSSTDTNLVVKATGTLDIAAGATLTATNLTLSSTGSTTVDGTITNGGNPGTFLITSGGNFTVSQTGAIKTTNEVNPVTINVTGSTLISGTTSVQTLTLKTSNGLDLDPTGKMIDGTENLTITGPFVIDGQFGNNNGASVFNVNATGAVVIGETSTKATILGTGKISGGSIINFDNITGSVNLIGTGPGEAFQNFGNIIGLNVTVQTTNATGEIFNAPGSKIVATQTALTGGSPTVNLLTAGVINEGEIGAIGLINTAQGILNITSPAALTISSSGAGVFDVGHFNAVNLTAKGNITVGGVVGGNTSNPFSNFTAANDLGQFTVNTTGTFSSPMPGVAVQSNTAGSFGGVISITASNVLYNGAGSLGAPFFLNVTGAGNLVSTGKTPLTLNLTGSQGITFGSAAGDFSANVEGFGNTSTTTLTATGPLLLNTANFNIHDNSLALSGSRVLITGDLNEGILQGTTVTVTTASTSPFIVGNATTNGVIVDSKNPLAGQGITGDIVVINAPGATVQLGSSDGSTAGVITGKTSVTLNAQTLTINQNSDVAGLGLTLNVTAGNTTYTNLNANGAISASALTINDASGILTLNTGANPTVLTVGTNPNGPGPGDQANDKVLLSGGAFSFTTQQLNFGSKGLNFQATGGVDGGSVTLNILGVNGTAPNITIGTGSGAISADLSGTNPFQPLGSSNFSITTPSNIVCTNFATAVNFGPSGSGGSLNLNSETGTVQLGGVSGRDFNLIGLITNSTTPLLGNAASGNGITDGNTKGAPVILFGGNLALINNGGDVQTNGVLFSGTELTLNATGTVDLSGNPNGITVFSAATTTGTVGAVVSISAQTIKLASTANFVLAAESGTLSGASVSISTFTTPEVIGSAKGTMGFNMTDMDGGFAATVSVNSDGAGVLKVDGSGINFGGPGNLGGQGGLNLFTTAGNNIALTNADLATGLNFNGLTINSGGAAFAMSGVSATGNGISYSSPAGVLTAGSLNIFTNQMGSSINTTGAQLFVHVLSLNAPSITFDNGTPLALQPEGTVGVTGDNLGTGGTFNLSSPSFKFTGGGVSLSAPGDGKTANSFGGTINITDTQTGTATLTINNTTFASLNVSNGGGLDAGTINISNPGPLNVDGSVFTYKSTLGTLQLTGSDVLLSSIHSLSNVNQDTTGGNGITLKFVTDSSNDFLVAGATKNGITDPAGTSFVGTELDISQTGKGNINYGGGDSVQANTITMNTPNTVFFNQGETVTAVASKAPTTIGQGGTITVNAPTIALNAGAGAVNFVAVGNSATLAGGNITISTNNASTFNVGNATGSFTFDVHNINSGKAGGVSITNAGGDVDVNTNGLTYGPTVANGSGSLSVTATDILVTGVAALSVHPLAAISLSSTSTSDFFFGGATVNGFTDTGATTLTAQALTISANPGGNNTAGINMAGNGPGNTVAVSVNALTLATKNTVTFDSGTTITLLPDAVSNVGGSLNVIANTIAFSGATGTTVTALGGAGANGGTINVSSTGTGPLVVGTGGFNFVVTGGAGAQAGNVQLSSGGVVDVDCKSLTFGPAKVSLGSGQLTITSPTMLISNVASLAPDLTSITLNTNSNSDFVFGGATVNGFADKGATTLSAIALTINANTGGTLGGGINTTGGTTVSTHNLTLATQNIITLGSGGNFTEFADALTGNGGTITVTAGALAITAGGGGFTMNALGGAGSQGAGGLITVQVASTQSLAVGASGLNFNVTNIAGQNGGLVSVTNGGAMSVDGNSITVGSKFFAGQGAQVILAADGALAVSNVAHFDPAGMQKLSFSADNVNDFTLGTAGKNGISDAGATLSADNIVVTSAGSAIAEGSLVSLNGSKSITLNASTDIGTISAIRFGGAADPTVFSTISLNASGDATINSSMTGGVLFTTANVVGDMSITASAGNLTVGKTGTSGSVFNAGSLVVTDTAGAGNNNTFTVGSISSINGQISLTSDSLNMVMGDGINLITVQSHNGNIVMNNSNTAAGANILFNTFSVVDGVGPAPNFNEGNVFISTGNGGYTPSAGITPTGGPTIVITTPGGAVDFGSSANPTNLNGSITVADASDLLQGLGRVLSFNTLNKANIVLNSEVSITADPPGAGGLTGGIPRQITNLMGVAAVSTPAQVAPVSSLGATSSTANTSAANTETANTSLVTGTIPGAVQSSGLSGTAISQPAINVSSPAGSALVPGLSFNAGTLNGSSISAMSAANNGGLSAGFLSSTGTSATAQTVVENALDTADGAGIITSGGVSAGSATSTPRTLTGGVSVTSRQDLEQGPLLLIPEQDKVVNTPHGSVRVAANSVALIISSADGLAVYNIHDTRKNAVIISSGGKTINLAPGCSAVLTRSGRTFEAANPAPFVSYRKLADRNVDGIGKLYQADFDIRSMLHGLHALKQMMTSDDARLRKTMANVLKTAAILMQISPSSEPYTLHLTPELTAYASTPKR